MKQRILFSLTMSFILSLLMTAWVTLINLGLGHQFVANWFHAFILSWPAAAVISFVIAPTVQKVSSMLSSV